MVQSISTQQEYFFASSLSPLECSLVGPSVKSRNRLADDLIDLWSCFLDFQVLMLYKLTRESTEKKLGANFSFNSYR